MRKGFLRKIGGIFVDTGDAPETGEASEELDDDRLAELAKEEEARQAKSPTPTATPGGPPPGIEPRGSPDADSLIGADFATIYAKTSTAGDPKTDQVLTTFGSLTGIPPDQLGTVLKAMMAGIQADPALIRETLAQRVIALKNTVTDERGKAVARADSRNAQLAEGAAQQNAQIEQMRAKIAELETNLAQLTEAVKAKNSQEQGSVLAFETNVKQEIARLEALTSAMPAPPAPAAEASSKKK